jgi:trehalose 6-phosphate phosphatase
MPLTPGVPRDPALLLDLDGTLLDLAPTPSQVVAPPDLPDILRALRARYCDAVAVVTGRPIAQIDELLGDAPFAVAGEHGGAIRHAPDAAIVRAALPEPPNSWIATAETAVARHPGALLERKARGFVLHYRLAPEAGVSLGEAAAALVGEAPDRFALLAAHMAWEIKPRGADKATAVAAIMAQPPFVGRAPVYVGDDVTDEDGMRAARALGGSGFRVAETFGSPAGVRAWLAALAIHQVSGPAQRAT